MVTLLLTRPAVASARFLAQVENAMDASVSAVVSPLIRIEPVEKQWDIPAVSAVVITSENGAAAARRLGLPQGLVAYTVGSRTAKAAKKAGLDPISANADADALIALIQQRGEKGPLLHLRGEHSRGDISPRLSEMGIPCTDEIVYMQSEAWLSNEARGVLDGHSPVVAPLFSARTMTLLAGQGPFNAPMHIVAMSDAVAAQAARLRPASLIRADAPDARSMLQATIGRLRALGHGPAA